MSNFKPDARWHYLCYITYILLPGAEDGLGSAGRTREPSLGVAEVAAVAAAVEEASPCGSLAAAGKCPAAAPPSTSALSATSTATEGGGARET